MNIIYWLISFYIFQLYFGFRVLYLQYKFVYTHLTFKESSHEPFMIFVPILGLKIPLIFIGDIIKIKNWFWYLIGCPARRTK